MNELTKTWRDEAVVALRDLGMDESFHETPACISVNFGCVSLYLNSDRSVTWECHSIGNISLQSRSVMGCIEARLDDLGWSGR